MAFDHSPFLARPKIFSMTSYTYTYTDSRALAHTHVYTRTQLLEARDVMVFVLENGQMTRVQIRDEIVCVSLSTYALGKGMNPYLLLLQLWLNSRADSWFF